MLGVPQTSDHNFVFENLSNLKNEINKYPNALQNENINSFLREIELGPPISIDLSKRIAKEANLTFEPRTILFIQNSSEQKIRETQMEFLNKIENARVAIPSITRSTAPAAKLHHYIPRSPRWLMYTLLYLVFLFGALSLFCWDKKRGKALEISLFSILTFFFISIPVFFFLVVSFDALSFPDLTMLSAPYSSGVGLFALLMRK